MGTIASQIISLTSVYSAVSSADQRKHKTSAPLNLVRGIHQWPVNSPHKGPVTRKMFPFDDVIILTKFRSVHIRDWDCTGSHILNHKSDIINDGFEATLVNEEHLILLKRNSYKLRINAPLWGLFSAHTAAVNISMSWRHRIFRMVMFCYTFALYVLRTCGLVDVWDWTFLIRVSQSMWSE